ncbi:MAG TPA: NAD-dependent epimerase/dehydratase family protein [Saprospiraceae bacterium]|nr:NAD-dependent epimerase/dehydratase family protein [Saprospiraceae bacterium]
MAEDRILVTGASGQIGTELIHALVERYGTERVVASDIKEHKFDKAIFVMLDILNTQRINEIIEDYHITQIYHLAAILSASGEWNPRKTWNVNLNSLLEIFDLSAECGIEKIFFPSSIAIYGGPTPKKFTPQHSATIPSTVYGMSKLTGELWCNYYFHRYGLDVRSIRYPGIISHGAMPGGGTTDYAVEIFYEALKSKHYTCFLRADTRLPMIYMEDAIRGTLDLMEAPAGKISIRTSYNLAGMDFTPAELAAEIKKHIPDFTIEYKPDHRQAIADSWTESIDDSAARNDWNWMPKYNLESMVEDMIENLRLKLISA